MMFDFSALFDTLWNAILGVILQTLLQVFGGGTI